MLPLAVVQLESMMGTLVTAPLWRTAAAAFTAEGTGPRRQRALNGATGCAAAGFYTAGAAEERRLARSALVGLRAL